MDLLLEIDAIDRLVRDEVDGDRPSVLHVRHRFRQRRLPIERHAPIDAALRPEHDGAVAFSDNRASMALGGEGKEHRVRIGIGFRCRHFELLSGHLAWRRSPLPHGSVRAVERFDARE